MGTPATGCFSISPRGSNVRRTTSNAATAEPPRHLQAPAVTLSWAA
jgi:hypothetical protein